MVVDRNCTHKHTLVSIFERTNTMERSDSITISDALMSNPEQLKTLDDVKKHFTEAEVVEIVRRHINQRWMARKAAKKQMARLKELKQWGREQGVWGKKEEEA